MNRHRQRFSGDDRGSVLVIVLGVAVLLMAMMATAVSTSDFAGTDTTQYADTSQGSLAAQAGLAVEITALRAVISYANFPCGSFSGTLVVLGLGDLLPLGDEPRCPVV
jgi:hypothetical protein